MRIENTSHNTCVTVENFTLLKNYILKHGEKIKLTEILTVTDKNTFVLKAVYKNRYIALQTINDFTSKIIVIPSVGDFPPYFIRNTNNELFFSAYYSRFDSKKDWDERDKDFCEIISGISKEQKNN